MTQTTTVPAKNKRYLLVLALALVAAVVLAIIGFVGQAERTKQNAALTEQTLTLPKTIAELENELTAKETLLQLKTSELTSAQDELEVLTQQGSEIAAVKTELETDLSTTEKKLSTASAELETLTTTKAELTEQLAEFTAAKAELETLNAQALAAKSALETQLAELAATKAEVEKPILKQVLPMLQTVIRGGVYESRSDWGYNANGMPVKWILAVRFNADEALSEKRLACSWAELNWGEDWEAAKQGQTAYMMNKWGNAAYECAIQLPDDPAIAGQQSVTIEKDGYRIKIAFELVYLGDYTNGEGWELKNVVPSVEAFGA